MAGDIITLYYIVTEQHYYFFLASAVSNTRTILYLTGTTRNTTRMNDCKACYIIKRGGW